MNRRTVARSAWLALARFGIAGVLFAAAAIAYRVGLGRTGRPALWAVLAVTAVVAAGLWSVRRPLAIIAERLAYGSDAGSYREVKALLSRMAATLPVDEVIPNLAQTLGQRAHSSRTEVRLNLDDGQQWSQVWPIRAAPAGEQLTMQVTHLGQDVGEIDFEPESADVGAFDRRLLDSIAGPAGIALSTVRLTYALRRRAVELAELNASLVRSQQRLIGARAGEWRRFKAEIDHRVMPLLDRAADAVASASAAVRSADPVVDLRPAATVLATALDVLRNIARGVFPPRLADAGLEVSLQSWRDGAATVNVVGELDRIHADLELEACIYFAVVTALDAVAEEGSGKVELSAVADVLEFTVSGPRSADDVDEAVLAARDRVEAFGGTLRTWDAGDGMMISGRIRLKGMQPS
jgi:hypothetical protein